MIVGKDHKQINYSELVLDDPGLFFQVGNKPNVFNGFSTLNVIIGKNNSGKSTFLRLLAFNKYISVNLYDFSFQKFKDSFFKLFDDKYEKAYLIKAQPKPFNSTLSNNFKNALNSDKISKFGAELFNQFQSVKNEVYGNYGNIIKSRMSEYRFNPEEFLEKFNDISNLIKKIENGYQSVLSRCYLPVLRSLRQLDGEITNTDLYFERTNKDYFHDSAKPFSTLPQDKTELHIFTGKSIYADLKKMLLGKPKERKQIKEYERFLSDTFFSSKEVTLIPNEQSNGVLEIMIEGDDQYPIYKVGDGLGQMIILTFPIFIREEPSMFFIEEPDLFMHAGMQRVLIEAMLKHNQHQYFITTHSNHILDIASEKLNDISLFMINKTEAKKFKVNNIDKGLRSINKDLGVRNTSVLLANASIWVEGVTDKLYLKAFMNKYLDELRVNEDINYEKYNKFIEDYHYIFVEYQGSNLPHYNFSEEDDEDSKTTNIDRLIGNAMVIADGDVEKKGERIKVLNEALGDEKVFVLKCKEIENLLPLPILKEAAEEKFAGSNLDKKGVIFDSSQLIAQSYMKNKKIGVGKFLDDCLSEKCDYFSAPPAKTKKEKTGAIKSKTEFCENVVILIESGEIDFTLNKQIRDLCLSIFEHINKCNQNKYL